MDRLICGYPVVPKAKTLMVYSDPDYTSPYPGYTLEEVMNFRADDKPYVGPVEFEYDDSITGPASVTTNSEGKATVTLTPNRSGLSTIICKFGGGQYEIKYSVLTHQARFERRTIYQNRNTSTILWVYANEKEYTGTCSIKYPAGLTGPTSGEISAGAMAITINGSTLGRKQVDVQFGVQTAHCAVEVIEDPMPPQ